MEWFIDHYTPDKATRDDWRSRRCARRRWPACRRRWS
jgi:hypothetical protein